MTIVNLRTPNGLQEVEVVGANVLPCQWFALCYEPAVALEPHPAFPHGVPICEGHERWVRLS